MRFIFIIASTV